MSAALAPAPAVPTAARPVTQARVIRSEATKLRALRSTWSCALIAVILIVGVGALAAGGKPYRVSAANPAVTAVSTSLFGVLLAQLVLGVLGVLVFSGEYGTGSPAPAGITGARPGTARGGRSPRARRPRYRR